MSEAKDGGYAFPVPEENYLSDGTYSNPGMSLRDYFAAKAMQSALVGAKAGSEENLPEMMRIVSRLAYMTADAMIAERNK